MKVLHSSLNPCIDNCIGVANQMYSELQAAKDLKLDYTVRLFTTKKTSPKLREKYKELLHFYTPKSKHKVISRIEFRIAYYSWLKEMEHEVDCFVLRYIPADPFQYLFIKNCRKPVCLIHHTKETDEILAEGNLKNYTKYLLEYLYGRKSIKLSHITSGVTDEIIEYELDRANIVSKHTILKPNGIYVDNNKLTDRRSSNTPELLFIASYFYDWHGLDLLIEAAEKSDQSFKIHLVGDINPEQIPKLSNNQHFIMHGRLEEAQIAKISEVCWASIGSLALYRKNIKQGSTLKIRSYLSMGLPVYSGYSEPFPKEFIFYKHFDGDLKIESLLNFCHQNRIYSKEYIRDQSTEYISIHSIINKFYSDIRKAIDS